MNDAHGKIEDYLLGELPETERAEFERNLGQDAELALATEQHRQLLQRLEGMRLRQTVQSALAGAPPPSFLSRWKWPVLLLAAAAAGLLAFLNFPATKTPPYTQPAAPMTQALPEAPAPAPISEPPSTTAAPRRQWAALAQKYHVQPAEETIRGAGDNPAEQTPLDRARMAYKKGDYRETLRLLKDLSADEDGLYFRANALFRLERYSEAAGLFKTLESSFQYGQEARWNRFLCDLADDRLNPEQARRELARMAGDRNFAFHKTAAKLAERLREQ